MTPSRQTILSVIRFSLLASLVSRTATQPTSETVPEIGTTAATTSTGKTDKTNFTTTVSQQEKQEDFKSIKVLLVTGSHEWMNGLYFSLQEGSGAAYSALWYGADQYGQKIFFYKVSRNRWVIGYDTDGTLKKARAGFRAPEGQDKGPPLSGWRDVDDNSFEGKKEGKLRAEMKVTPVGVINGTIDDFQQALGGHTNDGLVCRTPNFWTYINFKDDRICDFQEDCQAGWDEDSCLGPDFQDKTHLLISGGDRQTNGVYTLVRNEKGVPWFYFRVDGGAYLGKPKDWQISTGSREAVKKIRYKTKRTTDSAVPSDGWEKVYDSINEGEEDRGTMSNLVVSSRSEDQDELVQEEEAEVLEGVVCTNKRGDLLHMDTGDPRLCNKEEDCEKGRDERFCQWTANLSQEKLLQQEGAILDEKVVCLDYRERWWVTINMDDQRLCDFKCDCHSCWDEASCPWSENFKREDLMREEDRYRGMVEVVSKNYQIDPDQLLMQGAVNSKILNWLKAFNSSSALMVTGTGRENLDGVYISLGPGRKAAFRLLDKENEHGQHAFLFKVSENKWGLGFDKDESFESAEFQAPGREDEQPPSSGWGLVTTTLVDWPDMKITALGTINYESKVVEEENGAYLKNGLLCKQSENEKWLFMNESDGRICDFYGDCESDWDERSCLGSHFKGTESLVITGGGKRTNGVYMLMKDTTGEPSYYLKMGGGGYLNRPKNWQLISSSLSSTLVVFENNKGSESVPDFDWKEMTDSTANGQKISDTKPSLAVSSVPVESNQLILKKGDILEDRIVCEDFRELWWVTLMKSDARKCDLRCDCHNCLDETSCPLSGNMTQGELMSQEDRYSGMVGVIFDLYNMEKKQLVEERGLAGREFAWVRTLTRSKTFIVRGSETERFEGVYVSLGTGSKAAYRMMTPSIKEKGYPYFYKVTEDQWVLGSATDGSLQGGSAVFRAFGEGEEPPFEGWKLVYDDSFEGKPEGTEMLYMTVTSAGTTDNTLENLESKKGGHTDIGIVCEPDHGVEVEWSDLKWIFIDEKSEKVCDRTFDCFTGLDEMSCLGKSFQGTNTLQVSGGSQQINGIFSLELDELKQPTYYSRVDGGAFISKASDWFLGVGESLKAKTIIYQSDGESVEVPETGWVPLLQNEREKNNENSVSVISSNKSLETLLREEFVNVQEGVSCLDEHSKLLHMKREDIRICNGVWDCKEGRDERTCGFHEFLRDFIIVTGTSTTLAGLYEVEKDTAGNPGYYTKGNHYIYRVRGGRWALGAGQDIKRAKATYRSDETLNGTIPASGWSNVEDGTREGKQIEKPAKSILVVSVSNLINKTTLNGDEDVFVKEGLLCTAKNLDEHTRRLFITRSDPRRCNQKWDCLEGGDELGCKGGLASAAFYPPLTCAAFVLLGGIMLQILRQAHMWRHQSSKDEITPTRTVKGVQLVIDSIINSIVKNRTIDQDYKLLHQCNGGIKLLVGTGFTLLSSPEDYHILATFVKDNEMEIHGNRKDMLRCLRKKAGSDLATQSCLSYMEAPGTAPKIKSKIINWSNSLVLTGNNLISATSVGCFPIIKVSLHVWDFAKDVALLTYLALHRWEYIQSPIIHYLIVYYGTSILASSLAMCWTIQVTEDNGIINIRGISNIYLRRLLRIVLFLLTPLVPISIILKSLRLTLEAKKMVASWRMNMDTSPTQLWLQINQNSKDKKKAREAFSAMLMLEVSLEGIVQLFVLISFYFIPAVLPRVSGLGSEFEETNPAWTTWILLIGSPILTLVFAISSILTAVNINKGGQLGLQSQFLLGSSFFCQLASQLFRRVPTVLAALPRDTGDLPPALNPTSAILLLTLPSLLHLFLVIIFMPARVTELPEKVIHVFSNMWLVLPVRVNRHIDEVHKSKEQTMSLLLTGLITVVTAVVTAGLMDTRDSWLTGNLVPGIEFLVVSGVPALLCHFLGCIFLVLYYRCAHTWRELNKERDADPILVEIPYWEKVRLLMISYCFFVIFISRTMSLQQIWMALIRLRK